MTTERTDRMADFLVALARSGSVVTACRECDIPGHVVYGWSRDFDQFDQVVRSLCLAKRRRIAARMMAPHD